MPDETTAVQLQTATAVDEECQVIVFCNYRATGPDQLIRIWSTTVLLDRSSAHESKLLFTDNVAVAPQWMHVPNGSTARFTLIFSGLPRSCTSFDLIERIPEPGGFEVRNIGRNKTDVYEVEFL